MPQGARRQRRSPEAARQHILDAAERLLDVHAPDEIGLQRVAREAGVSHALITHYFATYRELVRSVLVRRTEAARGEVVAKLLAGGGGRGELLETLFTLLTNPARVRMFLWLRLQDGDAPPGDEQALRQALDVFEGMPRAAGVPREELEFAMLLTLAAANGYAIGRVPWLRSFGHEPSEADDERFRKKLGAFVRSYLEAARDAARDPAG